MTSFNTKILNRKNACELPRMLLCVSGGLDSMVMLDFFNKLENKKIFVSHINYNFHKFSHQSE